MSYDIVLGDLGPDLPLTLVTSGSAFVINAGTDTITLRYIVPGTSTAKEVTMDIVNAALGQVKRTWVTGDLPEVGGYVGQVVVSRAGDATFPRTFPSDGSSIIWWVHKKY